MKWGLGRKAQWLVEELNTLSTFLVAQFANWRGGRSSEALRVQSSRLAISTEAAPGSSLVRAEVSTADLANWCVVEGQCLCLIEGHSGEVNSVAVTPDEKYIVSASEDKTLRIWELNSGACRHVLFGHEEVVWRVAISPDGKILASGSGDDTVRLWSLESAKCLQTLDHPDCIAAVAFSPVGRRLVVGCDEAQVYIYKIREDISS